MLVGCGIDYDINVLSVLLVGRLFCLWCVMWYRYGVDVYVVVSLCGLVVILFFNYIYNSIFNV